MKIFLVILYMTHAYCQEHGVSTFNMGSAGIRRLLQIHSTHSSSKKGKFLYRNLIAVYCENVTIIVIIRHALGPERPVTVSSDSFFKGRPCRLRPFVLQFNIIFGILLLLILVTCCSQFDLYLLGLSPAGSAFSYSKICLFFL